jgi:predicted flap endonuclease-1-like 5' DNA nuclease
MVSFVWLIVLFVIGLALGILIAWLWLRKRIAQDKEQIGDLQASLRKKESGLADLNARVREKEEAIQGLEAQVEERGQVISQLEGTVSAKEEAIQGLEAQVEERGQAISQLEGTVGEKEQEIAALQAKLTPPEPEDLTVIEGIGPRISTLLQEAGILTYAQLAATGRGKLQQILEEAGLARLANPGTWSEQAGLAAAGDWDALSTMQDELKGGRR